MNKIVFLVLVGILSLSVTSCSREADNNATTANGVRVKPRLNQSAVNTETEQAEAEAEAETEQAEESAAKQIIAGLTPATDPDLRVKGIVRGRQDPFSVITVQPQIEIEEEEVAEQNRYNQLDRRERRTNRNRGTDEERLARDRGIERPYRQALAQDVVISGLIEINGKPKLIVNAPEETSSRYVQVGQYLSNGQILVKSIDLNHFPTPLVVLEQVESGIKVTKAIGEASDIESVSSLPTSIPSGDTWVSHTTSNTLSNKYQ